MNIHMQYCRSMLFLSSIRHCFHHTNGDLLCLIFFVMKNDFTVAFINISFRHLSTDFYPDKNKSCGAVIRLNISSFALVKTTLLQLCTGGQSILPVFLESVPVMTLISANFFTRISSGGRMNGLRYALFCQKRIPHPGIELKNLRSVDLQLYLLI